jgi:cobalt/nickel transport system ATP-binding protein
MTAAAIRFLELSVYRDAHAVQHAGDRHQHTNASDRRLVVEALTLDIAAGERLVFAGPNGAGKTSLLLAAVGALTYAGRVEVDGVLLEKRTLTEIRRKVGLVFADPSEQFFLPTVYEEVAFAPRQQRATESEIKSRTQAALKQVALTGLDSRAPQELSLGEQRRLAIACVLAMQPSVMLLDEPTASLDPRARRAMLDVIRGVDATIVIATHDLDAALDLESRVVLLDSGRLVAQGLAAEILEDGELLCRAGLDYPLSVAARKRGEHSNPR